MHDMQYFPVSLAYFNWIIYLRKLQDREPSGGSITKLLQVKDKKQDIGHITQSICYILPVHIFMNVDKKP